MMSGVSYGGLSEDGENGEGCEKEITSSCTGRKMLQAQTMLVC